MSTDQEKCLAAGMDDYLSKPVKQIDLAEALKRTDQVSIHELSAVITTTEELPDIDGCALIGLRDATDIDTVRTVIGMLRDEVPSIIADLEQAITKQDTIGLARLAHRLKGSTGTLGLRRIQMLCQDLETAARARDINRSAQLGHTITATLTVAIPLLEQHPVVVGTAV